MYGNKIIHNQSKIPRIGRGGEGALFRFPLRYLR